MYEYRKDTTDAHFIISFSRVWGLKLFNNMKLAARSSQRLL